MKGREDMAFAADDRNTSLVLAIRLAEVGDSTLSSPPDQRELKVGYFVCSIQYLRLCTIYSMAFFE